jgi:hypothetical protein
MTERKKEKGQLGKKIKSLEKEERTLARAKKDSFVKRTP